MDRLDDAGREWDERSEDEEPFEEDDDVWSADDTKAGYLQRIWEAVFTPGTSASIANLLNIAAFLGIVYVMNKAQTIPVPHRLMTVDRSLLVGQPLEPWNQYRLVSQEVIGHQRQNGLPHNEP